MIANELKHNGKKIVSAIKKDMLEKKLVDTGKALNGISYKIDGNTLTIYWLARTKHLVFGRGPGKRPPFDLIQDWVVRKLNPPENMVWAITEAICRKIEKEGTAIYRGSKKGLSIEIILNDAIETIKENIQYDYKQKIHEKIKESWH